LADTRHGDQATRRSVEIAEGTLRASASGRSNAPSRSSPAQGESPGSGDITRHRRDWRRGPARLCARPAVRPGRGSQRSGLLRRAGGAEPVLGHGTAWFALAADPGKPAGPLIGGISYRERYVPPEGCSPPSRASALPPARQPIPSDPPPGIFMVSRYRRVRSIPPPE
jgi:hypothetical protein